MAPLIGIGMIVVLVVLVGLMLSLSGKRRQRMQALATRLGLTYWASDPYGTTNLPFTLFEKGDGREAENVLAGAVKDVDLRLMDFAYYDESSGSGGLGLGSSSGLGFGSRSRTYHRYSCSVSVLPGAACPRLTIGREGILAKLGHLVGLEDIEFESEEFNRMFRVTSEDKKFAYAMVDAGMIDMLVRTHGLCAFEVVGPYLLVTMSQLKPADVEGLLAATLAFHEHLPAAVATMYPGAAPIRWGGP